jgi:hypothetical protein
MYYRTKSERQAWWSSLTPKEKAAYISKRESKRQLANTGAEHIKEYPPLTKQQAQAINAHMRAIGLERFIVLPD